MEVGGPNPPGPTMWKEIEEYFEDFPAQKKVAQFLLKKGFQVDEGGKILCGSVVIPHTNVAKELGLDRRAVDAAARRILKNEKLRNVYQNLQCVAFLRDVAPVLKLGAIVITAEDASKPGIIGAVTSKIAKYGISIRQAIADDPYLTDEPKLTVITNKKIPGKLLEELKKIEGIKSITY